MSSTRRLTARGFRSALLVATVALAAFWCGATLEPQRRVQAGVREHTSREQFKSGSARSEVVLHEIHATLKQMDRRLEHMETIMDEASSRP